MPGSRTRKPPSVPPGEGEAVFAAGDRVRVIAADNAYTGCRGRILEASGPVEGDQLPLGYYVAIDGENGIARPFLASALERVAAVATRPLSARGVKRESS